MGEESFFFTTRSALLRESDDGWEAIAAYGPAIRRWLASRYPRLPEADRDDVAQDILLEMRERLVPRHDPARGRFRHLLQVALKHRAIDRLRVLGKASGAEGVEEVPAPSEDDADAIELETALLQALAAARDELTHGPEADRAALYALADRIVHGKSDAAIAAAAGASADAVSRLLRRARERILRHLLLREIDPPPGEPALSLAVEVAREMLQRPAARGRALEKISDVALRSALDEFAARLQASRARFPALDSPAGAEFRRGLELVFS